MGVVNKKSSFGGTLTGWKEFSGFIKGYDF